VDTATRKLLNEYMAARSVEDMHSRPTGYDSGPNKTNSPFEDRDSLGISQLRI
jgi:hypothetical protein